MSSPPVHPDQTASLAAARLLRRLGRTADAIALLRKSEAETPADYRVPYALAYMYLSSRNRPAALVEFRNVERLAPGTSEGRDAARRIREK